MYKIREEGYNRYKDRRVESQYPRVFSNKSNRSAHVR